MLDPPVREAVAWMTHVTDAVKPVIVDAGLPDTVIPVFPWAAFVAKTPFAQTSFCGGRPTANFKYRVVPAARVGLPENAWPVVLGVKVAKGNVKTVVAPPEHVAAVALPAVYVQALAHDATETWSPRAASVARRLAALAERVSEVAESVPVLA